MHLLLPETCQILSPELALWLFLLQNRVWLNVLPLSSIGVIGLHLDNEAIRVTAGLSLGPSLACLTSVV